MDFHGLVILWRENWSVDRLFFSSRAAALVSRVSRLAASPLNARALVYSLTKSEENERLLAVYFGTGHDCPSYKGARYETDDISNGVQNKQGIIFNATTILINLLPEPYGLFTEWYAYIDSWYLHHLGKQMK